ncbi:MAG: hypothetical protein ACK41T_08980, partial [Pseudobdellovibrio sp.]
SGCGKNNDNNGTANYACPAGTTYYNGACYTGNGSWVQGASYGYSNGFYADTYSGTSALRITNSSKMTEFFKYGMGVCDRAAISGGSSSCQAYVGGSMDMIIKFPTTGMNTLLAIFIAQPRSNPNFNYSYQLPSGWGALGLALGMVTGIYLPDPKQYYGAYKNPLQLELAVSAINDSAGFSANGYGDYSTGLNRTKITIEVPQGKSQDNYLNFIFKLNDTPAAQGTFSRCRTVNCGL